MSSVHRVPVAMSSQDPGSGFETPEMLAVITVNTSRLLLYCPSLPF